MKRIIVFLSLIILCAVIGKANAVTRETSYNNDGETNFEKVGTTGNMNTGNPGYLKLYSPNYIGVDATYYLWIEGGGKLCIASYPTVSAYSSFPTGNWNDRPKGMGCVVVGTQS